MPVHQKGFTLVELMVVLVIVGILVSLALPQYQQYVNRAKFTEVITAVAPHKLGVTMCIMDVGMEGREVCNAGTNGIPEAITNASGNIGSIHVAEGVITATASASLGFKDKENPAKKPSYPSYILTPEFDEARLVWKKGGTCESVRLC